MSVDISDDEGGMALDIRFKPRDVKQPTEQITGHFAIQESTRAKMLG